MRETAADGGSDEISVCTEEATSAVSLTWS